MRFRKEKFDRLEKIKEEFKQWKKDQKIKQVKNEDDPLSLGCYVFIFLLLAGSIILFFVSFFLL